jgi:hypothetical protein
MNVSPQDTNFFSDQGASGNTLSCKTFPANYCVLYMNKEFFNLGITLQGTWDSPPFLARLYCRNGNLGRFLINLTQIPRAEHVIIYGRINVRYGDVLEWSNKGLRNLGLIYDNGTLLSFECFSSCHKFKKYLKKYLKSRRLEYISSYIAVSKRLMN